MAVSKTEIALIPITALAFLQLGTSKPCLLVGEGQFLKVFDHQRRQLMCTERMFGSQAIHGIACETLPQDARNRGTLLIWGGRSICLVSIEVNVGFHGKPLVKIDRHVSEVFWDDWILDGCLLPSNATDSGTGINTIVALFVTAHDDLLGLKFSSGVAKMSKNHLLYRIASGPDSILYSAHILWPDAGRRLLVAAGTLFGEVLLWSCDFDQAMRPEVYVHYRFNGHEGSVFGVRISELTQTGNPKRILASCSDDRTIRIWDISDTSSNHKAKRHPAGQSNKSVVGLLEGNNEADGTGCLAMIMGHAARIWGLRFLTQKDGCWDLMSYGEDSTAQAWRVNSTLDKGGTPHTQIYQISHQTTYSYHLGKNLWAMAVFQEAGRDHVVATGGADGRIATYTPLLRGMPTQTTGRMSQYTMDEVSKTLQTNSSEISPTRSNKIQSWIETLFDSLRGSWRLSRNLDSSISAYPSGKLEGIATFIERPSSDDSYDAEYLYSESGDFTTCQGLTMKATRQYVYRYCRSADAISVWFVKPDDGTSVDYFFHKLDFRETERGIDKAPEVCTASGYHLCVEDNYNASYSFQLRNERVAQWHAVFDVDGPKKGYVAKATYTRDQAESEDPKYLIQPSRINNQTTLSKPSGKHKPDAFKTYTWIGENEFLTTTEHGNLFVGTLASCTAEMIKSDDLRNVEWEHVGHQSGLISSSIATSISSLGIALLTGIDGTIYFYTHHRKQLDTIGQLPGKAGFLEAHTLTEPWNRWLQLRDQREMIGAFATCLGSPQATMFIFSPGLQMDGHSPDEDVGSSTVYECYLNLPARFTVTSSCFLNTDEWVILGSRNGDVAIYDLAHTTLDSAVDVTPSYLQNIHSEDAITLIQVVPQDGSKITDRTAVMTAGRDGKWAIHRVLVQSESSRPSVTLMTIHVGMPPFSPNIEGACIDSTSKDLLLWGFRSKQFVVWNESQKMEVMAVDCGGAHRHWAYSHNHDGSGGGSFVYTKTSVCHVHSQVRASHQVMQHGGHGREIKAMAVSPAIQMEENVELRLVATGAEDTNIRIFDLNANLKCLSIITNHTTGMQQLRWSSNGHLLFSAAGCEEFFVWRFQPAPLVTVGVVCEAQCPTVTEEADLRIMDFAIEEIHDDSDRGGEQEPHYLLSNVYSDSSVRIFRYHSQGQKKKKSSFNLLSEGSYTTYCLTQAAHLYTGDTLSGLCTASTDGHLVFWPLPASLSQHGGHHHPPQRVHPVQWTTRTPIHQNSVKSLASIPLSQSETLIVTGGDDGAIAFTRARTPPPTSPSETASDTASFLLLLMIPHAHASAVTGLALFSNAGKNSTSTSPHQCGNPETEDENEKSNHLALTLASVGNDQRLKIWDVHVSVVVDLEAHHCEYEGHGGESIRVGQVADVYTAVADAGALVGVGGGVGDGSEDGRWSSVLVAGIGIEKWGVDGLRDLRGESE